MKKSNEIIKNAKSICWYPSAGFDIPSAYFINTFSEEYKADLFILSDPIYRTLNQIELINRFSFDSGRQSWDAKYHDLLVKSLNIGTIKCTALNLLEEIDFGQEITGSGSNIGYQSPIYIAEFVVSNEDNEIEKKLNVLLVGSYNEPFCNNYLFTENIEIKFIVFKNVRGWGGYMTGLWVLNTIKRLKTEFLATEITPEKWNEGDEKVIEIYPELGPKTVAPIYSQEERSVIIESNCERLVLKSVSYRDCWSFVSTNFNKKTNSKYFGINKL